MVSKRQIDQIDQIGNKLKSDGPLTDREYQELLTWRNSFSPVLEYYFQKLSSLSGGESAVAIARRLKRIESIKLKLKRFQTMRLSTLQDIAGLRLIIGREGAIDDLSGKLRSKSSRNPLKRLDDYHHRPKRDGYRGIHFVYATGSMTSVEIQLRTELEHIWATAVEIYGELQNTSFKTGEGHQEWKDFFKILSSYFAIKESCLPLEEHLHLSEKKVRSLLKKAIKKLHVIEKLNATTNKIEIVTQRYNSQGRTGRYALLELNLEEQVTVIDIFNKKDISKAIEIYTRRELELDANSKKNIVFVNIENMEKIQKAYPNYFLNTKKLLEILAKIVLDEF